MNREVQVTMPISSNYPAIQDSSSARVQIYNKSVGVVEDVRRHGEYYGEESRSLEMRKGVRYRECRKNHAASMGGYAVDGCGEFMPSGDDGSPAAFKCAACTCHRNFHRREVEGETTCDCHHTRRFEGSPGNQLQHNLWDGV